MGELARSRVVRRLAAVAVAAVAVAVGGWQRARAVERLPPDYDELIYLPAAYRYAERMAPGRWSEIPQVKENPEHPPLVKLAFAAALRSSGDPAPPPEPDWDKLKVGKPLPDAARPPFLVARWTSWTAGVLQLAAVGVAAPLGALLLAVEPYHAKYTSQAYLEAIPGLFALLAVLALERGIERRAGPQRPPWRKPAFWLSAVALGLATAGKYPYGLVLGLTLGPFVVAHARGRALVWAGYAAAVVAVFVLADPFLWPAPVQRLMDSVGFHWTYSHGEHVRKTGLPWYASLHFLTHAEPLRWHRDVFFTGATAWLLPALALIGAPVAARRRPVWASWALTGMCFLFVWPTKWPQYLLLVLPALCTCAAHAPASVMQLSGWARDRLRRARASASG